MHTHTQTHKWCWCNKRQIQMKENRVKKTKCGIWCMWYTWIFLPLYPQIHSHSAFPYSIACKADLYQVDHLESLPSLLWKTWTGDWKMKRERGQSIYFLLSFHSGSHFNQWSNSLQPMLWPITHGSGSLRLR